MVKVNNTGTRNWDKNFDELGDVPQQTNNQLGQRTNMTGNYDPHHFGSGSMRLEIPQLDTSSPEKLELFLDCFTSITQFFPPDDIKKLILNTLIKNHQMELIPFLTDEILSSVDQFAEFLRQSYSSDEVVLRRQFDQIVQTDQDALRYFRLIFRSYYTSKKKVPPKDYKQIISETERADIAYKFISSLKDNRLREKLFLEDIKFSELPKKAAKFEEILKRSNPENKIFNVIAKVECELCGSKSHDSESCLASDKNKRQYRKYVDRSKSRDRGRSWTRNSSRSRYPSREPSYYRNYYRSNSSGRYRSGSRGRYRSRSNSRNRGYYISRSNSSGRYGGYRGRSYSRERYQKNYKTRSPSYDRDGSYRNRSYSNDRSKNYYEKNRTSPRVRFKNVRN